MCIVFVFVPVNPSLSVTFSFTLYVPDSVYVCVVMGVVMNVGVVMGVV